MKYISPSIAETAFNCPHCGVLTTQFWFGLRAEKMPQVSPLPVFFDKDQASNFDFGHIEDPEKLKRAKEFVARMAEGLPFLDEPQVDRLQQQQVANLNISSCFSCKKISVWIFDALVYPKKGEAPQPNPDLPDDIRRDYDEASSILDLSPRGAAALLRLAIQKLCKELGQSGKNINDDIRKLVAAGLDSRIQQALDYVRVVGNNAVHPGQIDFKDDRGTAEKLFGLRACSKKRCVISAAYDSV
ncbi:DUF4145 domain-containing protein, partial [uncultured Parvibaculum sp.]